jgi:hypothetical protein
MHQVRVKDLDVYMHEERLTFDGVPAFEHGIVGWLLITPDYSYSLNLDSMLNSGKP